MYIEKINKPNDIKKIGKNHLYDLADEIREFLIESISETGGHLGANLGTVELTMALHLVLNLPEDKIIWDVGHQSYTHKILTGRRDGFSSLRKYGGMAGFPKTCESECDAFNTGHSSTSISAGLGMAMARTMKGEDNTIVSVIGDGALTGGMAYEALNNAGKANTKFIVVLNDNNMSISENVGGVSQYLDKVRTTEKYLELKEGVKGKLAKVHRGQDMINRIQKAKASLKSFVIPGMFFEEMGLTYLGPVDGHDIDAMVRALNEAKRCKTPVLVHVLTKKGKGYIPAEKHPARFHGAVPFDIETGLPKNKKIYPDYTDVFSTVMCKMGERDPKCVAITAAMPDGTGLKRFRSMFPDRFFDVGIAEEHAVTFAAGMAMEGFTPVVCVYSSFLQRSFDQLIHDVCIQNLHVVFCIDRAGLVGSDGETHQGIFDLSYLSMIPNMCVMAPKNKWELSDMIKFALKYEGPIAIRYPRGKAYDGLSEFRAPVVFGQSEWIYRESGICLMAVGSMVKTAVEVRDKLKEMDKNVSIMNARFVNPLDEELIKEAVSLHSHIVTMEENVLSGGYSQRVGAFLLRDGHFCKHTSIAIPDMYVEHGNVDILKKEIGIDTDSIVKKILEENEGLS